MKAIEVIRSALDAAERTVLQLVEDMKDAPLTQPTPRGGNHPLWVLGHITFIEGNLPRILFGEPNPVAHWGTLFAPGTEPLAGGGGYPPLEEILRTYRDVRARNLAALERIGDAGLDRPPKSPPAGMQHVMRTIGETFLLIALHQMGHRGQVADARRAAGRAPIFTPVLT